MDILKLRGQMEFAFSVWQMSERDPCTCDSHSLDVTVVCYRERCWRLYCEQRDLLNRSLLDAALKANIQNQVLQH